MVGFYIDERQKDPVNTHRSGLNYIFDNLMTETEQEKISNSVFLDLNVDKTFHCKKHVSSVHNSRNTTTLPYRRPWVGVIHHTFDTSFSSHNNTELFNNKLFLESLKYCKGIIVLSEYLKKQMLSELCKRQMNINVYYICHPTESVTESSLFSYSNFVNNPKKKILHIGSWMRNIFSFYSLTLDSEFQFQIPNRFRYLTDTFKKVLLKCPGSDHYYPKTDLVEDIKPQGSKKLKIEFGCRKSQKLKTIKYPKCNGGKGTYNSTCELESSKCSHKIDFLRTPPPISYSKKKRNDSESDSESDSSSSSDSEKECNHKSSDDSCSKHKKNHWNETFLGEITTMINSVETVNKLSSIEYDKYLSENIVFINLIDASAVNTLIECIVRNTPIIINKIEPVVELLGEGYPLYYDGSLKNYYINKSIEDLLNKPSSIQNANKYLKKIDKTKFYINIFKQSLYNILERI